MVSSAQQTVFATIAIPSSVGTLHFLPAAATRLQSLLAGSLHALLAPALVER
jgi:hypothetical protein